jgi:hypothetical protein
MHTMTRFPHFRRWTEYFLLAVIVFNTDERIRKHPFMCQYLLFLLNSVNTTSTHEISRLETLNPSGLDAFAVWDHYLKLSRHHSTVKANYSWLFEQKAYVAVEMYWTEKDFYERAWKILTRCMRDTYRVSLSCQLLPVNWTQSDDSIFSVEGRDAISTLLVAQTSVNY